MQFFHLFVVNSYQIVNEVLILYDIQFVAAYLEKTHDLCEEKKLP